MSSGDADTLDHQVGYLINEHATMGEKFYTTFYVSTMVEALWNKT
jgi:hypothetical protein